MKQLLLIISLIILIINISCNEEKSSKNVTQIADSQQFINYWFAGNAEVSSYELTQTKAENQRKGEAILIFVKENFRTDSQVKLETNDQVNMATVLKMNLSEKIVTGASDYSLYSSVFTPVQVDKMPATLKVAASTQDWCGQTYTQLNFRHNGYQVFGKSYFENEVDADFHIDYAQLEDELWNKIRVSPERLPQGNLMLIPGIISLKMRHHKVEPEMANLKLTTYQDSTLSSQSLLKYVIDYPASRRSLSIIFEQNFPNRILGWQETYLSDKKTMTTKATLKGSILSSYWQKNMSIDSIYRKLLKLKY